MARLHLFNFPNMPPCPSNVRDDDRFFRLDILEKEPRNVLDWTPQSLYIGAFVQRRYRSAHVYVRNIASSVLRNFNGDDCNRDQLHKKALRRFSKKERTTFHVITYNFAAERIGAREERKPTNDLRLLLRALPKLLRRPRTPSIQMPFALVSVLEEDLDLFFETLAQVSGDIGGKGSAVPRKRPQRLLSQFRDAGMLETRGKVRHVYYLAVYLEGAEPITRFVRNFRHTLNARFGHQPQYKSRKDYESDREQIERLLKYLFRQFGILFNSPDWTGRTEPHALWVETTLPVWRSTDDTKRLQLHACAKGLESARNLKHITDHLNALAHDLPQGVKTPGGQPRIGETIEFFDALQAGYAQDGTSELIPLVAKKPPSGQRFNSIEARVRTTAKPVAAYYPSGQRIMYWFGHPLDAGSSDAGLSNALTEDGWGPSADGCLKAALDGFGYASTAERPFVLFRPSDPALSLRFLAQFRGDNPLEIHTAETRFLNYLYLYFAMFYARGFDMCYFRSYRFTYETTREAGHIHIFSTVDPLYSPRMVHFVRQLRHLLLNINLSLQDAITRHHWKASQVRAGLSLIIARNFAHNMGSHVLSPLSLGTGWVGAGASLNKKQVQDFMSYLRDRADLAAEIVGEAPPPPGVAMDLVSEMLVPMLDQQLLWNNIARSHGFVLSGTGKPVSVQVRLGSGATWMSFPRTRSRAKPAGIGNNDPTRKMKALVQALSDDAPHIPISMPAGVMGCHAFYMIVENFVRNCVKHGRVPSELRIIIEIEEGSTGEKTHQHPHHVVRLLCVFEGETKEALEKVRAELEKKVEEARVIHDDGTFTGRNRGLIEMKLAASFLRRYDIGQVDSRRLPPGRAPSLRPIVCQVGRRHALGYELSLHKPMGVLAVPGNDDDAERGWTSMERRWSRETLLGHESWLIRKKVGLGALEEGQRMSGETATRLASAVSRQLRSPQPADLPTLICTPKGVFFGRRWQPFQEEGPDESSPIEQRVLSAFGLGCRVHVVLLESLRQASDWKETETFGDITMHVATEKSAGDANADAFYITDHFRSRYVGRGKGYFFGRSNSALIRMFTRGANHEAIAGDLALAALTPIVIIDERVAELASLASGEVPGVGEQMADPTPAAWRNVPFSCLLQRMGIYVPAGPLEIPDDVRDLLTRTRNGEGSGIELPIQDALDPRSIAHHDKGSRQRSKEAIISYLKTVLDGLHDQGFLPPFLVIHQQIFDKLFLEGDEGGSDGLQARKPENGAAIDFQVVANAFTDSILELGFADVIVTSGRGIPTDIPRSARYVPIASLLPYVSDHLNKVYLLKTLFAARSPYALLD